jgi:polyhydroxyalkanoate synthesis repressor PhaR
VRCGEVGFTSNANSHRNEFDQFMSEARVIRKYPNRRLYDTAESRYITLSDIKQLVVNSEPFKVIDKKSGENITRSILLHVIAEQEETGKSVMSEEFLEHVIRAYADNTPHLVSGCLEKALAKFLEDHHRED